MGLLKKISAYLLFLFFIAGCAPSIIKLETFQEDNSYSQYGKSPLREFYYNKTISPSLIEKWESSINGGFSNSSVIVYDSAVIVNDLSGRIYCFSLINGKKLGQLKYKGSIIVTPIIHNTILIFALVNNNENITTLFYYDLKSGKEISSVEIDGRVTAEMLKINDGIILISEAGHIHKYDFSGKPIWDFQTKSFIHSSPASNNKLVVFGNDDGEIIGLDANDGKLVYQNKIGKSFFCGAIISGNEIYIGNDDGNLYAIDLSSGNVNWSFQTDAKIRMEAVTNETEVLVGNLSGDFYKFSKLGGKQIWKTVTYGLLNITPVLTNNIVILPDADKKVYFISEDDGKIVNSLLLDGRVKLNPIIKNNLLLFGYENGNLKAYEIN